MLFKMSARILLFFFSSNFFFINHSGKIKICKEINKKKIKVCESFVYIIFYFTVIKKKIYILKSFNLVENGTIR